MEWAPRVVSLIHCALVVFVAAVPFGPFNPALLSLHIVIVLGLVSHWMMGTDVCALTYLEAALRGVKPETSFIYSVVGPVFNISDATTRRLVFSSTIALGTLSAVRLWKYLLHPQQDGKRANVR